MDRYTSNSDMADFLERRLHAVKLAAGLMLKELTSSPHESIILSRSTAESIFATIDIFIEDAEQMLKSAGRNKGGAYREVTAARLEAKRPAVEAPSRPLRSVKPLNPK